MNSIPATLRRLDQIESPPGLPLLGNALQIDPPRMHLQMERWAQRYGRFFSLRIGGQRLLAINDTGLSQQILRERPDRFRRLRTLEPIARELGMDGLFSAEGERWKAQRRLWLATLNAHQIRSFHDQLMLTTRRLMQRWQRAADSGEAVDIAADLMRYTVDVTIHFALGHEANTLEKDDDVIQRHLDRIFPALNRRLFGIVPYWRWFKLPQDRALDRSLAALRAEVGQLIDGARRRLREQPALRDAPTCFLEAFLAANERDGAAISDADVFANAITVLLGGEDTTANTMAWLIHACCDRPDVYASLRAEADALLDDPAAADPNIPRADRFPHWLPATDAAINETLRIYPVAPAIYLETIADTVIEDIEVPAGTPVTLLLRAAAGSSPHSEPAPRFDPVADAARSDAGPGRAATMPFGYGPRMCPGRNLALAELRSATLMLARNFDIEAVPQAQPVAEKLSFTLVPENLRVRFKRRVR